MPGPKNKLDDFLNEIEINCDPPIGSRACVQFCLDCLALIRGKLPPIAEEALSFATECLEKPVPVSRVNDMLTKCWQFLDENHRDIPIDDARVSVIRAAMVPVYCLKHPTTNDVVDHLSFFLKLLNNVEPHFEDEEVLLRQHFANCLTKR